MLKYVPERLAKPVKRRASTHKRRYNKKHSKHKDHDKHRHPHHRMIFKKGKHKLIAKARVFSLELEPKCLRKMLHDFYDR